MAEVKKKKKKKLALIFGHPHQESSGCPLLDVSSPFGFLSGKRRGAWV